MIFASARVVAARRGADSQAEVYLLMSQPERSLERYGRVLQIDPTFTNAYQGRAAAFGLWGQFDSALGEVSQFERLLRANDLPTVEADLHAGLLLARAGRYRDATARLARSIEVTQRFEDHRSTVYLDFVRATIDIERNDLSSALAAARRMKSLESQVKTLGQNPALLSTFVVGLAEARAGRLESARAALGQVQQSEDLRRSWENFVARSLEGEIALAARDFTAAERAFAAAEPQLRLPFSTGSMVVNIARNNVPFRDGSGRAFAARGNLEGAVDAYRRLLALDISQKWTAILEPRLVLQLARLLERKGDVAAAR